MQHYTYVFLEASGLLAMDDSTSSAVSGMKCQNLQTPVLKAPKRRFRGGEGVI